MKARFENGCYVFLCPVGYKYERVSDQGRMLVRNEPTASIIQEALEGFASGHFATQAEVKEFLEQHQIFSKDCEGGIHPQRVTNLLKRKIYAGIIESKK